jgi:hypothetical protein
MLRQRREKDNGFADKNASARCVQRARAIIELSHDWLGGSKAVRSNELEEWRFRGPGRGGARGGHVQPRLPL